MKKTQTQAEKDFEPIKQSLQKEIALGKKYGFNVKKHWKAMLQSLSKEKKTP